MMIANFRQEGTIACDRDWLKVLVMTPALVWQGGTSIPNAHQTRLFKALCAPEVNLSYHRMFCCDLTQRTEGGQGGEGWAFPCTHLKYHS